MNQVKCTQTCRFRFTIYGALFGLCFPLAATHIQALTHLHEISWSAFFQVQSTEPLLWIINSAPFFLGLFANFIGKRQDNICRLNGALEEKIENQMLELFYADKKIKSQIEELHTTKKLLDENTRRLQSRLDQILDIDGKGHKISLLDLIDIDHLQKLQDSFAKVFNIATVIIDTEGNPITEPRNTSLICSKIKSSEKGARLCRETTRTLGAQSAQLMKPKSYKCAHCGLLDAAAPIIIEGRHIATWLVGQNPIGTIDRERLIDFAQIIGADPADLESDIKTMPRIPLHKFENIVDLAWNFVEEISSLAYSNLEMARELARKRNLSLSNSAEIVLEKKNY